MGEDIELPKEMAIPAILAIAALAWLFQPEDLRRNPALEAMSVIGAAKKYEVMYAQCTDGTGKPGLDAMSLAKGFAGAYSHRFPALNDKGAAAFAAAARPQCAVASLYRLDRYPAGSSGGRRFKRTKIEI